MMDKELEAYLNKLSIKYKSYRHKPVFTVGESGFLKKEIPGMHSKNLFLEDENGNFYLVCMNADKRLDMKRLRVRLGVNKLQFASPGKLYGELRINPGSVSIFAMIHAGKTKLILDKELWDSDVVSFHANVNTETLALTHENLDRFYSSLEAQKEIIEL